MVELPGQRGMEGLLLALLLLLLSWVGCLAVVMHMVLQLQLA